MLSLEDLHTRAIKLADASDGNHKRALDYFSQAVSTDDPIERRRLVVMTALALGGDVWRPTTPVEQLRHDLITLADQMSAPSETPKRKRKTKDAS